MTTTTDTDGGPPLDLAKIRARRLAAGLSQEKLARLADVSTQTVRMIDRAYTPTESTLDRIDAALRSVETGGATP